MITSTNFLTSLQKFTQLHFLLLKFRPDFRFSDCDHIARLLAPTGTDFSTFITRSGKKLRTASTRNVYNSTKIKFFTRRRSYSSLFYSRRLRPQSKLVHTGDLTCTQPSQLHVARMWRPDYLIGKHEYPLLGIAKKLASFARVTRLSEAAAKEFTSYRLALPAPIKSLPKPRTNSPQTLKLLSQRPLLRLSLFRNFINLLSSDKVLATSRDNVGTLPLRKLLRQKRERVNPYFFLGWHRSPSTKTVKTIQAIWSRVGKPLRSQMLDSSRYPTFRKALSRKSALSVSRKLLLGKLHLKMRSQSAPWPLGVRKLFWRRKSSRLYALSPSTQAPKSALNFEKSVRRWASRTSKWGLRVHTPTLSLKKNTFSHLKIKPLKRKRRLGRSVRAKRWESRPFRQFVASLLPTTSVKSQVRKPKFKKYPKLRVFSPRPTLMKFFKSKILRRAFRLVTRSTVLGYTALSVSLGSLRGSHVAPGITTRRTTILGGSNSFVLISQSKRSSRIFKRALRRIRKPISRSYRRKTFVKRWKTLRVSILANSSFPRSFLHPINSLTVTPSILIPSSSHALTGSDFFRSLSLEMVSRTRLLNRGDLLMVTKKPLSYIHLAKFALRSLFLFSPAVTQPIRTRFTIPKLFFKPAYSWQFISTPFAFVHYLLNQVTQKHDVTGTYNSTKIPYSYTVFPDSDSLKAKVFRRLNRQKMLFQKRRSIHQYYPQGAKLTRNIWAQHSLSQLSSSRGGRMPELHLGSSLTNFSINWIRALSWDTIPKKKVKDFNPRIRRIRFKPGYSRIWRTARTSVKDLLDIHVRYQYRLTPKLHSYYLKLRKLKTENLSFTVAFALLSSRFSFDNWTLNSLVSSQYVFLNGNPCTNLGTRLFVNDFIQLVVSLKFYITIRWLENWSYKKRNKVAKIFYRKLKPGLVRGLTKTPKKSRNLPRYFFDLQYSYTDIPKCFEVDYFSLSIFVIHDQLFRESQLPAPAKMFNPLILNMYNWKYIT